MYTKTKKVHQRTGFAGSILKMHSPFQACFGFGYVKQVFIETYWSHTRHLLKKHECLSNAVVTSFDYVGAFFTFLFCSYAISVILLVSEIMFTRCKIYWTLCKGNQLRSLNRQHARTLSSMKINEKWTELKYPTIDCNISAMT